MKVKNNLTFEGSISSSENFNSSFIRVKMKVFAFGGNRNGSAFSQNSFSERAQKSLSIIPIVAKYNAEMDDLEGHNVHLIKDSNGDYDYFHDTFPFGTTGNDTVISYEEVNEGTEAFPDIKTYVTIDNVYLWKRYDATRKIDQWIAEGIVPKISMEIDNVEGQFDSNGFFQINDFEFRAIAALGSDVEPCFPRAEIETYSKQSFNEEFKALVYELKETFNDEGGTEMTEEIKPEVEIEQVEAEFEQTEVVEPEVEVVEEQPEAEVEAPEESFEAEAVEATEVVEAEVEPVVEEEVVESIDYEAKFNDLTTEFEQLQSKLSELEELKSYKRNREEMDVQAKFADKLSEEEFTQVFEAMKEASIADVEDKLFALYGKKNFSVKQSATQTNKAVFSLPEATESVQNPYGDIFK